MFTSQENIQVNPLYSKIALKTLSESFYHFKISDYEAFTYRCPDCQFGYFSEEYFKRDHIDCATNSEEKNRENIAPGDVEKGSQGNFSRHLKIIDCPVNLKLNTGEQKSPLQPLRGKSQVRHFVSSQFKYEVII